MVIERTKNATRNVGWGFMEKIVAVVLPFISRTIIIRLLGEEYLGLNSLFSSILSVLSITELGVGTAIVFSMYKPIAEDDNKTLGALLNLYRKLYRAIGTIVLALGLAVIPFLQFLIKGHRPADVNIYILYGVHLFDTVIGYYLFSYRSSLFYAHQRNDLVSKVLTAINIIGNTLRITLLIIFRNYYAFIVVLPIVTVTNNLAYYLVSKKYYPQIRCEGSIPSDVMQSIKKRIIGMLSFKIYGVVFTSVDTIVISAFLGLTPLAMYNNYYYIQSSVVSFLVIFTSAITAGIGNKMITNTVMENYSDFMGVTFLNAWISGWCSVCLVCMYQHFMKLWAGPELVFPFSTMILMVFYFLIPRITTVTYIYREAAGLWWEDRFRPLVSTAVNVVINLILVNVIGMNGVIISTIVCSVFINVPWGTVVLFKNYFKTKPTEFFIKIIYYMFATVIAGSVTFIVCSFIKNDDLTMLFVKMIICVFLPNIIFFLMFVRMKEFVFAKKLFWKIFKRKSSKYV